MAPAQFRDGLAVCRDLPSKCDGCGASLTMQHALDCKVGGLVIQRHIMRSEIVLAILLHGCGHRLLESQLSEMQKHK